MYSTLKRIFIGPPIASSEEHHHRLPKTVALAVFASDAISSTAYATEEILVVLVPLGGLAAFEDLVPIAFIVVALLAIVVASYRQTIHAYPNGGGSYVVSRENLGRVPSLVAAASLSSTTSSPSRCRSRLAPQPSRRPSTTCGPTASRSSSPSSS